MHCVKGICYGHLKNCFLLLLITGKSDLDSKYFWYVVVIFMNSHFILCNLKYLFVLIKSLAAAYEVLEVFLVAV